MSGSGAIETNEREVVLPYYPRPHQQQVHDALRKFRFVVCVEHRRGGKTYQALWWLISEALATERVDGSFGFIAPTYRMAKEIAWRYLKRFLKKIPAVTFNEAELRADLPNGARIRLAGSDNPDSLRGVFWDAVVMDEVAQMPANTWAEVIRPALADRKGRGLFIGTPKGENLLKEMFDHAEREYRERKDGSDWRAFLFPVTETSSLDDDEVAAARREMSPELFEQEFMCSWTAAVAGSYYAEALTRARDEGRIGQYMADPEWPVWTAWDLGMHDYTAIWFVQLIGTEVRVIDFLQSHDQGLPNYVHLVKEKPYIYAGHFGPHDIAVRDFSGDGTSRWEMARRMGLEFTVVNREPVLEREWVAGGIEAGRLLLARATFNEAACLEGLRSLEQYHAKQDRRSGRFLPQPDHEWSDAADAWRTLAVGLRQVGEGIGSPQGYIERPQPDTGWIT